MPWPNEAPRHEAIKRYIRDLSTNLSVSTHKDFIAEIGHPEVARLCFEVATLAAHTALERYDTENRIIVEQADSFHRMIQDRENSRPVAMHIDSALLDTLLRGKSND
jgi:hypothetical protein